MNKKNDRRKKRNDEFWAAMDAALRKIPGAPGSAWVDHDGESAEEEQTPAWVSIETVLAISTALVVVLDERIPGWREMSGELLTGSERFSPEDPHDVHYLTWSICVMNRADATPGQGH